MSDNGLYVAERKIYYSDKGRAERNNLTIRVTKPYAVDPQTVNFDTGNGVSACKVCIHGIDMESFEVYGADDLQAVHLASNIESLLRRISKNYDLFWLSGEPYFE